MDLELTLDAREAQGKANKRLRRAGIVPGVVFGKGQESTPVQVDAKTFETLYRAAGRTSVVKLRLPGASRATSGIIKSVQRHPLSGNALHVDYFLVNLRQEMEVEIPLAFTGEAPAVEETGGTLIHNLSTVLVRALPNDLPHEISVDVSSLVSLDSAIRVADLQVDTEKVHVVADPETLVATVVPPRVEEVEEVPAELEEGVEGEAPAEGEGPAEGAAAEGQSAPAEGGSGESSEG
ncbi:MAG TPA: 50S ribosomal protein L25 [Candidatus Limnocylindria bacterium]|nr:50S ribosomal protein L25 [Candidatus Limnocylindria bacterium]